MHQELVLEQNIIDVSFSVDYCQNTLVHKSAHLVMNQWDISDPMSHVREGRGQKDTHRNMLFVSTLVMQIFDKHMV